MTLQLESEPSSLCMRDEACSALSEIKLNFQHSNSFTLTSKGTPTSIANWSDAFTTTTQSVRHQLNFNPKLINEPVL